MSSGSLDKLSLTAVKDISDDSSISELSDIFNFSNVSSSDLSPSVELRGRRYSPAPDTGEKIDLRGRRKTRMAPQPPGHGMRRSVTEVGLVRSRSFNEDKARNQVVKQGSTDSDNQVSQYLDLDNNNKTPKETPSSLRGVPRDKSRFKALKDALRSPRHIRKTSRKEKTVTDSPSPSFSKFRPKRTTVTTVSKNQTFGIVTSYIDNECEFEVKRIAEYDRYLQNLLAETDPSHQDYESLNNAVKRVNAIKHIAELDKSSHTADTVPGETDVLSDGGNDQADKSRTVPSNKRDTSSSAVIFKHLTVGSKFRPANNWSQSMGLPIDESEGLAGNTDERMYVMEGPVIFTSGSTKQDRYLFLFSDILLVAKEKSSSTFKLKYRVNVTDLLIACIEAADNSMAADRSFIIGWKSINLIATFNDAMTKEMWLNNILERRNAEKAKQQLNKLNATRRSNDTDESEDEAYYEEAPNRKHKRGPLLNIFKKTSREDTPNANELTRPTGKLFGQPLETVCTTDNEPPKHVLSMLEILFREGAYTTGILRKSANMKVCKEIKKHIDESDNISLEDHQVLAIGSVLKDYLRSIPKSLLLEDLYDDWMEADKLEEKTDQIKKIKELLTTKLPTCHLTLLKYVMCVLHHIDENSTENKMSASNLAVCIAPSLLSSKNKNANMNPQSVNSAIKVIQLMIENCLDIFGENVVHLFGSSSIGHKIRPDSDSDSMHSILSTQESTGGMRRDGSSMDSLVEEVQLYHGESSPKSGKSHISPSSLSHDSGLITSDSQAYEDDLVDSDRKLYMRSMSSQDRSISYSYSDCGSMYSRSMESTSSFETQEPVAPPRRKKDFPSSSTFDTFINYPRPQSAYARIGGLGKAVRSHPDLGKRLSGDSLKSVEEAAEDLPSEMSDVLRPTSISSKFRGSEPMLSVSTSREKVVRQSAISDGTPPASPISPSSYFTSSRDSLTSESSTSNNQFSMEEVTDLCQTNSKYEKDSDSNSYTSTIVINHFGTPEHQTFSSSQNSSPNSFNDSMNKSIPVTINHQNSDPFTADKPSKFVSSPIISVTQCSSSSEEILDDDDDDFGFKKSPRAPVMKLHQQASPRSPPPRVVLESLKENPNAFASDGLETGSGIVLHQRTQRRNSLDSLSDFRIEQKTNEIKHRELEGLMAPRQRVTVIHRSRLHSPYSNNYMSMTDLSAIKAEQARQHAKLEEHRRPAEPPSYNEAMQRNFKLLCGLPPDISDQDTKKQKEASARAKELYQKSIQAYESDSQHKQTTRSSEIKGQVNEDNDVYVTLSRDSHKSRNPLKIYEESMQKYESSAVECPKSVEQISNPTHPSTSVNLHRSQSDLTSRPMSKLTLRLNEQNRQTQSTSCLDPAIKNLSQPPSYKDAMISKKTIKDYTQPEATQVPIIVEKSETHKDISQNPLRKVSDSNSAHRQSKAKSDLPWNVSAMTKMFEHQSGSTDSPYSKSVLPPPYHHPPPFKRENSGARTSVSSNSSGGSFITTQTKHSSVRRSGPQHMEYSFSSSSEDLNSSGSFSHCREDSVESCEDFTDVSYV